MKFFFALIALFLPLSSIATGQARTRVLGNTIYPLLELEEQVWNAREKYGITGHVMRCGKYVYLRTVIKDGRSEGYSGVFISQKTGRIGAIDRPRGLLLELGSDSAQPTAQDYKIVDADGERHGGFIITLPRTEYDAVTTCMKLYTRSLTTI